MLERVERHTIEFSAHRERLLAAGRHLRRGLLLHGQPGTGKTLIAMYLAGRQPDRTVLLVTGRTVGLLRRACELARLLAPSTVVLEDVDLIAEERTRQEPGCTTLLFELLNEMDGLAEDVEVVFVLTTNRPDLLEPALAARPGRVDLVVEVPLPDAACRRRLIELYGRGITLRVNDMDDLVEGLEGASPAFIRELLRKAALLAVGSGREIVVEDGHLANALRDLVTDSGILGRRLLGMSGRAAGGAPAPAPRRPSAPEVDQMAWSPLALTVGSLDAAAGSTCPAPHFRIVTELPACLRQQAERSRPERGT